MLVEFTAIAARHDLIDLFSNLFVYYYSNLFGGHGVLGFWGFVKEQFVFV